MRTNKTKKLINLQIKMIAEEKMLWILMMVLVVIFVIMKAFSISLFENDNLKIICDNVIYSIIAAFIFYVLTVFYPRSKTCLEVYHNIYQNVARIDDVMEPTFKLFIDDTDDFRQFPQKFVEKFVEKKDKEHDKYTIAPLIVADVTYILPKVSNMMAALRSRYSDYLQPKHLLSFDVFDDISLIITNTIIKKEMTYKEVELVFLRLTTIYIITQDLLNEYKQFE